MHNITAYSRLALNGLLGFFLSFLALTIGAQTMSTADPQIEKNVLEANTDFYTAFRTRNTEMMAGVWARDADVSVIHPGWPELEGRDAVLESWARIMGGDSSPEIYAENALVHIQDHYVMVYCEEVLGNGRLDAVNIFVLENGEWKMVHHRAIQPNVDSKKFPT
jgi:hypothetical protein